MAERKRMVAEERNYQVVTARAAKEIASTWLQRANLSNAIEFGLPEIDDRYHLWRIPLVANRSKHLIGEVVIDANTSLILIDKSTDVDVLEKRLLGRNSGPEARSSSRKASSEKSKWKLSSLRNTVALGDCEKVLRLLPSESVGLIFTSPPYFNAKPEYADYLTYEEYLYKIRKVIHASHRVLGDGRFFVMNVSPVLIRRKNRSESSRRIAVPFDLHGLFIEEGFEFIDDIIWVKPEGAGWATGRGRRFAADRNPLQYKPVPVTEYLLVYRRKTDRLIDWNIRAHPNPDLVEASRIDDDYEKTNVWQITPAHDQRHPAIFPLELAERVITYYSFKEDVVLDPFAGIGTTGKAAFKLERRFVLIEKKKEYVDIIKEEAKAWMGKRARYILTIDNLPVDVSDTLI